MRGTLNHGRATPNGSGYAETSITRGPDYVMSTKRGVYGIWRRLAAVPGGRWLFARLVCRSAPYFATIRPAIDELRPGRCEVRMRRRRAIENHIRTVHAIAICNLAELAAGLVSDVTVPATHRWIPKGMTVDYLKKAATDVRAVAELELLPALGASAELPVYVTAFDTSGEAVFRATIRMWVSQRH
jgi:acyl-coenzyme A thioesterase PaaI-like protein